MSKMDSSVASTREKWAAAGQGHVFDEFDCLTEAQQTELLQQLNVRSILPDISLI